MDTESKSDKRPSGGSWLFLRMSCTIIDRISLSAIRNYYNTFSVEIQRNKLETCFVSAGRNIPMIHYNILIVKKFYFNHQLKVRVPVKQINYHKLTTMTYLYTRIISIHTLLIYITICGSTNIFIMRLCRKEMHEVQPCHIYINDSHKYAPEYVM